MTIMFAININCLRVLQLLDNVLEHPICIIINKIHQHFGEINVDFHPLH